MKRSPSFPAKRVRRFLSGGYLISRSMKPSPLFSKGVHLAIRIGTANALICKFDIVASDESCVNAPIQLVFPFERLIALPIRERWNEAVA